MDKKQISTLPLSVRKHIRQEKARIRREFSDLGEQEEQIKKIYQKFVYMFPKLKIKLKKVDKKTKIQKGGIKKTKKQKNKKTLC